MVPTYGQGHVILRAVDSALAQDYGNLEVIVSDDASPDDTLEIVARRTDPRLTYHRNPVNLGRVANYRHTLYDLASGEWVVNLDGDDYFTDPHFISSAVGLAMSDDRIVIVSARQTTKGASSQTESQLPPEGAIDGRDLLLHLHDARYSFTHLSTLYRRAPALSVDFYRADVLSTDLESLFRLACDGRVAYLDRNVGVWVKHGLNASSTRDATLLFQNLSIWPSVFEWGIARGIPRAKGVAVLRRQLRYYVYGDLYYLVHSGAATAAIAYARRFGATFGWDLLVGALAELALKLPYRIALETGKASKSSD